ncbi:Uncharacterized protein, UPF0548 family [Streptomyces sp. DvalAA-14]|uniref:DUF1990 family protein n=1 Tax=unclassified Streptomyces TaxID=2593676 RepID=UPI00081B8600|nr:MULTISPECIES: DUF1990 domain-containing protein [unclassified Streptomyces]MYS23818.1 DUF1990 family protein [Streptomyces sp. SID4948]SCE38977.1 Uncharacterized protein, UPF0548 family [Streptomyces sp. DvalAA-14]
MTERDRPDAASTSRTDPAAQGFTYREVGGTAPGGRLPPGYRHLRYRTRLGTGREVFDAAGRQVLTWRMHRALGVRLTASAQQAAPGVRVRMLLGRGSVGPVAPCEVVWAVADQNRIGFGYGTLPGHPERGEEAFLVELAPDGAVWFTVTAFSRPALWYTRALGPLVPLFQHLYARRCGQVLRKLRAGSAT